MNNQSEINKYMEKGELDLTSKKVSEVESSFTGLAKKLIQTSNDKIANLLSNSSEIVSNFIETLDDVYTTEKAEQRRSTLETALEKLKNNPDFKTDVMEVVFNLLKSYKSQYQKRDIEKLINILEGVNSKRITTEEAKEKLEKLNEDLKSELEAEKEKNILLVSEKSKLESDLESKNAQINNLFQQINDLESSIENLESQSLSTDSANDGDLVNKINDLKLEKQRLTKELENLIEDRDMLSRQLGFEKDTSSHMKNAFKVMAGEYANLKEENIKNNTQYKEEMSEKEKRILALEEENRSKAEMLKSLSSLAKSFATKGFQGTLEKSIAEANDPDKIQEELKEAYKVNNTGLDSVMKVLKIVKFPNSKKIRDALAAVLSYLGNSDELKSVSNIIKQNLKSSIDNVIKNRERYKENEDAKDKSEKLESSIAEKDAKITSLIEENKRISKENIRLKEESENFKQEVIRTIREIDEIIARIKILIPKVCAARGIEFKESDYPQIYNYTAWDLKQSANEDLQKKAA